MSLITELYVFGSFARGALEPHDVDIDAEFKPDWRWSTYFADCLAKGRDPHAPLKRTLTGASEAASSSSTSTNAPTSA